MLPLVAAQQPLLPVQHMLSILLLNKPLSPLRDEPVWCANLTTTQMDPRLSPFLMLSGKGADDFGRWD